VDLCALFSHQQLKLRERGVRHAAAGPEALDDLVLDVAEQRDVLRQHGQVVRPAARVRQALRSDGRTAVS
jgi:hypothetical protein